MSQHICRVIALEIRLKCIKGFSDESHEYSIKLWGLTSKLESDTNVFLKFPHREEKRESTTSTWYENTHDLKPFCVEIP